MVIAKITEKSQSLFYDIPHYVTIGFWEVIHIYPCCTMWRNLWASNSKSCHYVDFTFLIWFDLVFFIVACKKSFFRWSVDVKIYLPLLWCFIDKHQNEFLISLLSWSKNIVYKVQTLAPSIKKWKKEWASSHTPRSNIAWECCIQWMAIPSIATGNQTKKGI